MHIDNQRVMLLNGGPKFKVNPSLSLFVNCTSSERVQSIWNYLMQGGKSLIGMGSHPWSTQYGWLQDKYGVTWQIVPANMGALMTDSERSQRVMKELCLMKKIELSILENA